MFRGLDRFGLPAKYAIIGAIAVPLGIWIARIAGMHLAMGYLAGVIAGAVGGGAGGWLRQRQGKTE